MQNVGITTHLRDYWEDAIEDNRIDAHEQDGITRLIAAADDSVRLSLTILKVGDSSRATKQRVRDYERVHGPIELERERRQRRPVDLAKVRNAKARRRDGHPDSAA